ncbi:hypothetical protein E2C01_088191 [Portunus trituberculatus]|uniref:Secreted protein n=1 Tax=Portunus trituberculatus TaxID=210409 RepID=A0A5B7JEQ6_PORTR|nr:hypothetical protein [Portunus trituberculatus]
MLAPCLVRLFQLCLSTSTFPSCWKFACVKKILKHLSLHNLLSDCQYGFCQGCSTGDLAFLTAVVSNLWGAAP